MRTIVWFRGKDLRIGDHAPLREAVEAGEVVPLFVVDPYFFAPERARALPHRMQFLLDGLHALAGNLASRGTELVVVEGRSVDRIPELAERWAADRVVAHRWVEPFGRRRDARIGETTRRPVCELHEGETLWPPGTLRSGSDRPYAVFSAFARAFRRVCPDRRTDFRRRARLPARSPTGIESERALPTLDELGLTRNPRPSGRRRAEGPRTAASVSLAIDWRTTTRNETAWTTPGTSRLSADLKFGTISARQVWHAVVREAGRR